MAPRSRPAPDPRPMSVALRDGSVRVHWRRGQALPSDHPAVLAYPSHFRAVEQRAVPAAVEQRAARIPARPADPPQDAAVATAGLPDAED